MLKIDISLISVVKYRILEMAPKKYWSLVNKILMKAKILKIPPLRENDIFLLDFGSKTQLFNNSFILQCTALDAGSEIF